MPDDLGLADDGSAGVAALRAARDADTGDDVSYETEASASSPARTTAEVETATDPATTPAAPDENPSEKPAAIAPAPAGQQQPIQPPPATLDALVQQISALQRQFEGIKKPTAVEQPTPETPPPGPPDPETDPMGAIAYAVKAIQDMQAGLVQREQTAQIRANVEAGVTAFRATAPDYDDAIAHMRAARTEELRLLGLNDAQVEQALNADAIAIIQGALSAGENPAARAYQLAKLRGYAPKAASPAATTEPASPPKLSGAALISHAAKVANAAGSLSQAPGGAPSSGPRTFAEYAALTPKARAALPPEVHARFRRDED